MLDAFMTKNKSEHVTARLRSLRERAGFSMAKLAEECGYKGASSYQRYEDETIYQEEFLPLKLVRQLDASLSGHGSPPITQAEIYALSGMPPPGADGSLIASIPADKQHITPISIENYATVQRFDARMSAGPGSIVDPNAEPLGYHLFERQWLNAVTRAGPEYLAVVRVDGDSMEHTLNDGDWILVDRSQRRLNREGIYALQVGDACWVKRVTLNLKDRLIRVISDNPIYPVQELPESELTCIGRVVWIVGRAL